MASSRSNELLVVLDTNFLMSAVKFSISLDYIRDVVLVRHRIVVPSNVKRELRSLDLKGGEARRRDLALQLADHFDSIELSGHVDNALLELGRERRIAVATNDIALRRRLRRNGIPVIYIRNRSRFASEGLYQNI
jgi:hypothetical protein